MKKLISLFVAIICAASLFGQTTKLPVVLDVVTIENENTGETVDIVNIPIDGVNRYYLHVGNMGIGNKVVQVNLDPIYRLYIPLGNNITEAIKAMEDLKTLFKEDKGATREIKGSFEPFFPTEDLLTVQVSKFKFLVENKLQFVIECDGFSRVAYMAKSDFNSLLRGLKLYGKIHRSEM